MALNRMGAATVRKLLVRRYVGIAAVLLCLSGCVTTRVNKLAERKAGAMNRKEGQALANPIAYNVPTSAAAKSVSSQRVRQIAAQRPDGMLTRQ